MRCIVHLSDLHFGRITPAILPALAAAVAASKPDLIVVSGDVTQRARREEFAQARAFLDTLPRPQIVVPGNHDVPLYNVLHRWLAPLRRFRETFGDDLQPFYGDAEIAVVGINSARSLTVKNGRINTDQVVQACRCFGRAGAGALRVAVMHHPLAVTDQASHHAIGRSVMAMEAFARCGVDVVLSGHIHTSDVIASEGRHATGNYPCLLIQAGTATSQRQRGEANAFNTLLIEPDAVRVRRHVWSEGAFAIAKEDRFPRHAPLPPA